MADSTFAAWIPLVVMLRYAPPTKPSCALAVHYSLALSYPPRRKPNVFAKLLRLLPTNYLDAHSETLDDGETELHRLVITIPLRSFL